MDNFKTNSHTLHNAVRSATWTVGLTEDALDRVLSTVIDRHFSKGSFVCRKGERVEYWYGVVDGLLKLSSDAESGKTASLTGVPPGGWFGEGSLLKNENRKYDAVALRDTRMAVLPRQTFLWLLDNSISFNRYLLTQLNERLGQFICLLESERLLDTDARVARCLATLFNPQLYPRQEHRLSISQEELGYLTGISRQRTNRTLHELEKRGFLSVGYGAITILDLEGLRRFGN